MPGTILVALRKMPVARRLTLACGAQWEPIWDGAGEPWTADDCLTLDYADWGATGELIHWPDRTSSRITGDAANLPYVFLEEFAVGRRVGDILRIEVDARLFPSVVRGAVWQVEVTEITSRPQFRRLGPSAVSTSRTGLMHEALTVGDGALPKAGERLRVRYVCWLNDGPWCHGSFGRGAPAEIDLSQAIPGLAEGLLAMRVGDLRRRVGRDPMTDRTPGGLRS